ncbi:MAG: thioredoxin [Candidatus Margulisiibacteriota bacterium]
MAVSHVSDSTFKAEVLDVKDTPVLVDFWAEWCGPCRMLAPVVESLSNKFSASLKVCKLDTDSNPETAQAFQITGIPCCILFQNGKEVTRLVGYRSESAFEAELKNFVTL